MAKEEQPNPSGQQRTKSLDFARFKQTIAGFEETTVIHPRRSTVETSTHPWQRAQRQHSGGVRTFAGGSDGIRFSH